jgi:membrane-bound metal-dependent hydrolase YbcI (DUF457 family)
VRWLRHIIYGIIIFYYMLADGANRVVHDKKSAQDTLGFHIFPGLVISIRSLLLLHVLLVLLQRARCGSVHCGCHRLRRR